jgi:hypothetical protein
MLRDVQASSMFCCSDGLISLALLLEEIGTRIMASRTERECGVTRIPMERTVGYMIFLCSKELLCHQSPRHEYLP